MEKKKRRNRDQNILFDASKAVLLLIRKKDTIVGQPCLIYAKLAHIFFKVLGRNEVPEELHPATRYCEAPFTPYR